MEPIKALKNRGDKLESSKTAVPALPGSFTLRMARHAKGWTQIKAAKKIGCSQSYLSQIETGYSRGSEEFLTKISVAYGLGKTETKPHPRLWKQFRRWLSF